MKQRPIADDRKWLDALAVKVLEVLDSSALKFSFDFRPKKLKKASHSDTGGHYISIALQRGGRAELQLWLDVWARSQRLSAALCSAEPELIEAVSLICTPAVGPPAKRLSNSDWEDNGKVRRLRTALRDDQYLRPILELYAGYWSYYTLYFPGDDHIEKEPSVDIIARAASFLAIASTGAAIVKTLEGFSVSERGPTRRLLEQGAVT